MGNLIANGIVNGSSTYTASPGFNLSWWWNSPIYTLWRTFYALATLMWVIIRTVVYTALMLLQTVVTLLVSYRFIVTWLVVLSLTWIYWMEFPFLITIVRETWGLLNTILLFLFFIANLCIRLYNMCVLIWNPFYPIVGFFLYVIFDLTIAFLIEIVKILGEPAIGQLVFLYMSYVTMWPQLFLALVMPILRFMPSVMMAIIAQVGPIVEIVMSVTPVLFPMISWTFGRLFFTLEPILSMVVWAVKKVQKLFGRSSDVLQAVAGLAFIGRQLLHVLSPVTAAGLSPTMTAMSNATMGAVVQQDIAAALGDLSAVEAAMRTAMEATTAAAAAAAATTTTTGAASDDQPHHRHGERVFDVPEHAPPNYNQHAANLNGQGVIDDAATIWNEVGAFGMKAGWHNAFAVDAARKELATVRRYLVEHPPESYEELSMRDAQFIESLHRTGSRSAPFFASSSSVSSVGEDDDDGSDGGPLAKRRRSLFGYHEVDNVAFMYVGSAGHRAADYGSGHRAASAADYGSDALHGSSFIDEEELSRAKQRFLYNYAARHGEDDAGSGDEGRPPTAHHHLHVQKLTVLGTPPHMLEHARIDPLEIERAHSAFVNRTHWAHPRRVRMAIEQDIAAGMTPTCQGSIFCGGKDAPMSYHPSAHMRKRHQRYRDVRTDAQRQYEDEMDMERMKNRVIVVDTIQHAGNVALHRYANVHAPHTQSALEHHVGTVLLKSVLGYDSAHALLDHLATNYSTWGHFQHVLHERFFADNFLYDHLMQFDPNAETRPFYKQYMAEQQLHFVMERDETHGHMVPNIYVEQTDWVPPSQRQYKTLADGRRVPIRRRDPTGRVLLYTLPLFDFLSKLDCYTTTPRAPFCLPDVFPDNWQLNYNWLPLEFPFPDDINVRCFCAQFFCEQPRLYSKIFPYMPNPLPNWQYFFGPCRYWNGIVVVLLLFQYVLPLFFLSVAALTSRYRWARSALKWVFILPAGEVPSIRIFLCMTSHVYDVLMVIFTVWLGGGIVFSRFWPIIDTFGMRISVWLSTVRQREEDVRTRKGQTLEAELFNTAYDSTLNKGRRDFNDPQRDVMNSLGVRQWHYNDMDPGGADVFYDTFSNPNNVELLQYYGIGGGQAQHLLPPYANYRTRYEQAAEAPDLQRDPTGFYYRPGQEEFNDATQAMAGDIRHFINKGVDDNVALDPLLLPSSSLSATEPQPFEVIGRGGVHTLPAPPLPPPPPPPPPLPLPTPRSHPTQASPVPIGMDRAEAELLADMRTIEALRRALTRNLELFGQPWFPIHAPTYNAWHFALRWLLDSHHFTNHWQQQMINVRRRIEHERLHYTPVRGPMQPPRRTAASGGGGGGSSGSSGGG